MNLKGLFVWSTSDQHGENTKHRIDGWTVDSWNVDLSTVPLPFCMVADQFLKIVNLVKINSPSC
jgi:hypothetical protein